MEKVDKQLFGVVALYDSRFVKKLMVKQTTTAYNSDKRVTGVSGFKYCAV